MSTATDKIRAGLDQRQKASGTVPISNLFGAPSNLAQLKDTVQKLATTRDKLAKLASNTVAAVESSRADIEARYGELGKIREGRLVTDTLGDNQRRAMVEREHARAARAIRKANAEERDKLAAEVRDLNSKLDGVRDVWGHPVTILDRRTRLDPNRVILTQNLQGAGIAAITNAMRDAVVSGSAPLAMAALQAAERLPKETKKLLPYSARDVATAISEVRQEYETAGRLIGEAEVAAVESELAQARAEGSRDTARLLTRVGVLKKELGALLGDPGSFPDDLGDDGGTEDEPQVIDSLEAFERYLDGKYPPAPKTDGDAA